MTETERPPLIGLPGFFPDAIPFAVRTAVALLLAYAVGFYAQVPSASSAGVTVGIIAQPSTGMALSKAFYRIIGTSVGCVVSILFGALFGQDRTMLLLAFALWMGLCGGMAVLLRDFRSYGAALSGYTVAIVAIGGIDDPDGLLLSALNRTAAVMIGIVSVALVNLLTRGTSAYAGLVATLHRQRGAVGALALDALEGRDLPDGLALTQMAAAITGLQSEAIYASTEQPNRRRRHHGAQVTIGSLLTVMSASRTIGSSLTPGTAACVCTYLREMAQSLRTGGPRPLAPPVTEPFDALLVERAEAIAYRLDQADAGLVVLTGGTAELSPVVLRQTVDGPAALIAGARSVIAFGLAAAFIVLAGWPGATLVLIQQAAFVGLLGASPTPVPASILFLWPLLPAALAVGPVNFLALPLASGFGTFSLWVGGLMFVTALVARHRRLAPYAPAALIYVTLLLQPANPQTFDLAGYFNTVLEIGLSVVFTVLAFVLILPVSPKRRLYRVIAAVAEDLRRTRRSPDRPSSPAIAQARLYDRLVRALTWLGPPTGARRRLLSHLYRLGAWDIALNRARTGLAQADRDVPDLRSATDAARDSLNECEVTVLLRAARALLADPAAHLAPGPVLQAVSGMADLALQEGDRHRVRRFLKLMTG